jgi:hypothetical protein
VGPKVTNRPPGREIFNKVVDKKVDSAGARVAGDGLTITLDTGALLRRLSLAALLDPILALLPADLRTQLTPWLNLSPRFVFVLGTASSQASEQVPYLASGGLFGLRLTIGAAR